jgi:hypothetical protein
MALIYPATLQRASSPEVSQPYQGPMVANAKRWRAGSGQMAKKNAQSLPATPAQETEYLERELRPVSALRRRMEQRMQR